MANYSVWIKYHTDSEFNIIMENLGNNTYLVTDVAIKINFKTLSEIMPFVNNILGKLGRQLGNYNVWDNAFNCWQRMIEPDEDEDAEVEKELVQEDDDDDEVDEDAYSKVKKIREEMDRYSDILQKLRVEANRIENLITKMNHDIQTILYYAPSCPYKENEN